MQVRVTHLKAPWPPGTQPGDVVRLEGRDTVPDWAVGKCEPVADEAPAPEFVVNPAPAEPAPKPAPKPARKKV